MKKIYVNPQTTCNVIAQDSFLIGTSNTPADPTTPQDAREEIFDWEEEEESTIW